MRCFSTAAALALSAVLSAATIDDVRRLRTEQRIEEARRAAEELVVAEPDNADAHYWLGHVLLDQAEQERAQEQFELVEELGRPGLALIGMGRLALEQERFEEARRLFDEAQQHAQEQAELYYYRGLVHARLRNYADAAADFEKSLELDPANAMAHYYAGLAYNALKRPDQMVSHFQIFLKMAPDAAEAPRVRSILRAVR